MPESKQHAQGRILLLLFLPFLFSCTHTSSDMKKYISPSELQEQLGSEHLLIIDTRSRWEYEKGHIPGATHVPFWKAPFTRFSEFDCKDKTTILYCEHGPRAHISRLFVDNGCHNVKILEGHMQSWKKASYPLDS